MIPRFWESQEDRKVPNPRRPPWQDVWGGGEPVTPRYAIEGFQPVSVSRRCLSVPAATPKWGGKWGGSTAKWGETCKMHIVERSACFFRVLRPRPCDGDFGTSKWQRNQRATTENLRPSGYESKDRAFCVPMQRPEIILNSRTRRGSCRHRSIMGRHATSRDFRSVRQPGVNGLSAGEKPEGCTHFGWMTSSRDG